MPGPGSFRRWQAALDTSHRAKSNTVIRAHSGTVKQVAFTPDGRSIVSLGADNKLIVSDVKSGEPTLVQADVPGDQFALGAEGRLVLGKNDPMAFGVIEGEVFLGSWME